MSALEVVLLLTCRGGGASCLARMREVLDCVERVRDTWPALDQWEEELPEWFVRRCAQPMSKEDARAWLQQWRSLSPGEQARVAQEQEWSLPDWLYWMEPARAVWTWSRARQLGSTALEVTLTVDGLPAALGAFEWLARASGAEEVTRVPHPERARR